MAEHITSALAATVQRICLSVRSRQLERKCSYLWLANILDYIAH
ncbi:hypothetical protein PAUR_a2241 [Pseudoalteromonas aurantia 208]|uniref:Transposase n=1 Tax=Pseudoalteromonas aurantia 208 TaxID=1314867 RepID=A0ABR9ECQ3_9GAMM|nr:hypothetical protein [Pseudoalteromonas aurantia 208]